MASLLTAVSKLGRFALNLLGRPCHKHETTLESDELSGHDRNFGYPDPREASCGTLTCAHCSPADRLCLV